MNFTDLIQWTHGKKTMFMISQGEINVVDVEEYNKLPLGRLPKDARLTTSYRTAALVADYQRKRAERAAVERS